MSAFDIERMKDVVEGFCVELREIPEAVTAVKIGPTSWSLREVVGHLVDSAANNHQRFVRLQSGHLEGFPGYDTEGWIVVQRYREFEWDILVELWYRYNQLLLHIIRTTSPEQLSNQWRRDDERPTLEWLVNDYFRHLEEHIDQFRKRLAEVEKLDEAGKPGASGDAGETDDRVDDFEPGQTSGANAMILLAGPVRVDTERLEEAIRAEFAEGGALVEISSGADTLAAVMDERTFLALQVPAPVPDSELEEAAGSAWYWLDVRERVEEHSAHIIVQVNSSEPLLDRSLLLARLCGVFLRELNGIGVYLGVSSQLVQKELFLSCLEAGREDGSLPVPLLVHIARRRKARGRTDLYTVGLEEYGLMELEVSDTELPWKEIYEVMLDFAHHLLRSGTVIPDGAIRGTGGYPRIRVRHEPSAVFADGGTILHLYI